MRPFLKNRLSALTAWLKRHPLIGTALGLFLVYLAYEFCTTFLVICRDAYVTADIVAVSPEVSGPMLRLAVTDNQSVAAGDLLFTIDPRPYQIELDREKAALATEWIRLARRFPVEIDLSDLPDKKDLFLGSNATVWWIQR